MTRKGMSKEENNKKLNKNIMNKTAKPYFTHASKSMGGKPEKFGLPSNKQIANSVYAKCGKK